MPNRNHFKFGCEKDMRLTTHPPRFLLLRYWCASKVRLTHMHIYIHIHIQTFLFTVPTLNLEAGQSHTHFRSVLVSGCVCVSVSVGVAFVCCTESKAISTKGTMCGGGHQGGSAGARARGPSYYAMYCLCNENVYVFA